MAMDWIEWLRQMAEQLQNPVTGDLRWFGGGALLVVLLVAWLAGILRMHQHNRRMLRILDEGTPEEMQARSLRRWGFTVELLHPPAPYQTVVLHYTPSLPFDVLSVLLALAGRVGGRLTVRARFQCPPVAELAWIRGGLPNQAFQKETNAAAWIYRPLPILNSQYATRGNCVEPLMRAFVEFQARFAPAVLRLCIQRDAEHELEVVVAIQKLRAEYVPHLLASLWMLSRASMRG